MHGLTQVHESDVRPRTVAEGVEVRELWNSGSGPSARKALVVTFAPGARWPGDDVHEPGPEEVFVVEGTFTGLAGPGTEQPAGSFVHCEAGSSHRFASETGGRLFVFYPDG